MAIVDGSSRTIVLYSADAESAPSGVVVLDATRTGHSVRWHPMRMHPGPVISGLQTVQAEWGETRQHDRGALPEPVDALLGFWRSPKTWADGDIVESYETLVSGGYSMHWVDRDPATPQPKWMRLLRSKRR
ncbi:hypothetical protein ACQPWY_13705 [Pseudonocardia xinjiangensis]|uniref:hypothetical protein n=1 Tax=Pseudonocardia xinjiangensis TaxID=75289 RepID=UPI003D8B9189